MSILYAASWVTLVAAGVLLAAGVFLARHRPWVGWAGLALAAGGWVLAIIWSVLTPNLIELGIALGALILMAAVVTAGRRRRVR